AARLHRGVELPQRKQFLLVERGEVGERAGAQVTSGALDPEDLDGLAGDRVRLGELGRGVPAARVGDALIRAEQVGAVNQAMRGSQGLRSFVVLEIVRESGSPGLRVGEIRSATRATTCFTSSACIRTQASAVSVKPRCPGRKPKRNSPA